MQLSKRHARVLILSSVLFFATSCTISFGGNSNTKPAPSSKEQTSSVLGSSEANISNNDSPSSAEESSSTIDPQDPNKALKRSLSSTYKDYGYHNIANFRYVPSVGSPKFLIIPVWFTDSSSIAIGNSHKEDVRNDIEKAFIGTKEETGWNSVKTYYQTLSDNRCNINGIVTEWWECEVASTSVASSQTSTMELVQSAVDWYFAKEDAEPRQSFDYDEDGYLDGVMLIYGAPDYRSSRNYDNENLWAYCSWLRGNQSSVESPNPKAFLWASYDFMYDGSKAFNRAGRYYGGGDTSHCEIDAHTFIHESGHLFGFNDYYDYSQQYNPAGGFSMQDENVGSHDPYSVLAAGWVDPIIPFESTSISIRPFQNKNHDLILIANGWNGDNSPFDEYLLIEFYTPTGLNELDSTYTYNYAYPKGPSESGIRLWHVDSRLIKGRVSLNGSNVTWSNRPFTDPETDGCYLMYSNTSYNSRYPEYFEAYGSVLGSSYADYNLLQLIKNDTNATYKTRYGTNVSNDDLFQDGSTFNMSLFSKQFVNGNKLNCKDYLGWEFDVEIEGTGEDAIATINLTRAE